MGTAGTASGKRILRLIAVYLMFGPIVVLTPGCSVSEDQEVQLGRESCSQFEAQFGGRVPDPELQQYVHRVGMEMARYANRPKMQWQFRVLNSDQLNAFAVPGGSIYVTRGLLLRLGNEAQLAGVLAHECGHIAHRDAVEQMMRARAAQGASAVAGIFGGTAVGSATNVAANVALLRYGREQEKSADIAGLEYMTRASYNPRGIVQAMQILVLSSSQASAQSEFLSTHPDPGNRLEYLCAVIDQSYSGISESGRFDAERFREHVKACAMMSTKITNDIDDADFNAMTWCGSCRHDANNH